MAVSHQTPSQASAAPATRRASTFTMGTIAVVLTLAIAGATSFAWILHTQLARLYGLTAPVWDLGQGQQLLWSLANGHGWTSSYEGKDFLGIHIEPVLLVVAAVEKLWPTPVVPLVFAATGLALTAPAAYLMFRAVMPVHPWAAPMALALSASMPFWALTQEAGRDQFHPENLAPALAMLAVWAGLRSHTKLYWTLVVALLCCKEDQTYTAFVVGLLVQRFGAPAMRSTGRRTILVAIAWLVVDVGLLSVLARGAATPGLVYYWWMLQGGHNYFLDAISRPDPWLVLAGLIAGLLALPLLAPRWLLLMVPPLALSLLSNHDPMERLQAHYGLIVMFPMVAAAAVGARRLLEARRLPGLPAPAFALAAVPALVIGFTAGRLPPALGADGWLYQQPQVASQLLAAKAVIPSDATVYADDGAAVWLSDRQHVSLLSEVTAPDSYVVIDRDAYGYRNDAVGDRADEIARMEASGRPLLYDDGRFQIWGPVGQTAGPPR